MKNNGKLKFNKMSKSSPASKNTLFKYFARSPSTPTAEKKLPNVAASPLSSKAKTPNSTAKNFDSGKETSLNMPNQCNLIIKVSFVSLLIVASKSKTDSIKAKKKKLDLKSDNDDGDEEEEIVRSTTKRKFSRIIDTDSESDRENESNNKMEESDSDSDKEEKITRKRRPKADEPSAKKKIKLDESDDLNTSQKFEKILQANLDKTQELSDVKEIVDVPTVYRHQKLDFIKPDKIKDANQRKPDHPEYDPTTLYVPRDYLDSLTPVSFSFDFDQIQFFF